MSDWFREWLVHHATLFGITAEPELKTLSRWKEVFDSMDATAIEVHSASSWLAANPEGIDPYRGKMASHLAGLVSHIRQSRAVPLGRKEKMPDVGSCTTCSGAGYVVVPHLAGVKEGRWVGVSLGTVQFYTCAVFCSCALGRWKKNAYGEGRPMSFEEYEAHNPDWKYQIEGRRREQRVIGQHEQREQTSADEVLKRFKEQYREYFKDAVS